MFFSWSEWGNEVMCFWPEDRRGQFHHIIPMVRYINMTYHHRCWPWSSGRGCVCLVSPLWSYSFNTVLFRRKWLSTVHTYRVGSYAPSPLRWTSFIIYLEFICIGNLCLLSRLFSHLFTWAWTHRYLFYTLDYNLILLYLFCCSDDSSFGHWALL